MLTAKYWRLSAQLTREVIDSSTKMDEQLRDELETAILKYTAFAKHAQKLEKQQRVRDGLQDGS